MTGPSPGPARRGRRDPALAERIELEDGLEVTIGGPDDEPDGGEEQWEGGIVVYPGDVLGYSFGLEETIRGRKVKFFFTHKTSRKPDEEEHDTVDRLVIHVHTRILQARDDAAARLQAIDEEYEADQSATGTTGTTSGPRLRPTR